MCIVPLQSTDYDWSHIHDVLGHTLTPLMAVLRCCCCVFLAEFQLPRVVCRGLPGPLQYLSTCHSTVRELALTQTHASQCMLSNLDCSVPFSIFSPRYTTQRGCSAANCDVMLPASSAARWTSAATTI